MIRPAISKRKLRVFEFRLSDHLNPKLDLRFEHFVDNRHAPLQGANPAG